MDMKRTRWVRRLKTGVYTIESDVNLTKSALCNLCGISDACPILKSMNQFQDHADIQVKTCGRYVPLVGFRAPYVGLKSSLFNTLRLGTAWVDRLSEGKTIAVTDAKTGKILRFGKVDRVVSGPFDEMILKHGMMNHMALGGKTVAEVETVLRKAYHNFMKEDPQLTAIYIRDVSHDLLTRVETVYEKPEGELPLVNNVITLPLKLSR